MDLNTGELAHMTKTPMRERLIETGRRLFIEQGFDRVSLVDIARHTPCSRSTAHVHFKNKDELFKVIAQRDIADLDQTVPSFSGDLKKDLIVFATNYYAFYTSRPFLLYALPTFYRDKNMWEILTRENDRYLARLTLLLGQYAERDMWAPQIQGVAMHDLTFNKLVPFTAALFARASWSMLSIAETDFDAEEYVDLFLFGYLNPEKRSELQQSRS